MANSNYTITIKKETSSEKESPIAGQSDSGTDISSQTIDSSSATTAIAALVAFKSVVNTFVEPVVDEYIQTVQLRTGSSEAQQRLQFAYGIAKQAVGLVSSVAIGFVVGNIPGAILGAVTSVAGTAMNYAKRAYELGLEQNLESISLRGLNVRAGGYAPSYSASRMRNQ